MRTLRFTALVALALIALPLAGCNSHTDKVSDIMGNPTHYAGRGVTVAGEVTQVHDVDLGITDVAAYRVSDGTGQVWVLTHAGPPRVGDKVGLKGTVRPEGKIGTFALGSVIEEQGRKTR